MVTSQFTWLATPINFVSYRLPLGVTRCYNFLSRFFLLKRTLFRVP